MAAVSDRLSGAVAFKALQPLDGHGFADLVMTGRRPAAQLVPLHRVDHPVAQILRIPLCHPPAGLRPASRLNQKSRRFGNPHPIQPKRRTL
jgi:hypothetical protein